ncbi:MAG: phenylalanine--tRNA ligase subunit beta [Planctomycetota bacterium]|jgi:phenylalanyl-tRNA synthetase beta chain
MRVSLDWLKDYVEIEHSPEEVAEILSDLGLPCEGIEHLGDDAVIDVEVTSNRGDCLGYIGVARELAVVTGKELKMLVVALDESERDVAEFCSVEIVEPDLCGRYTARIVEGVKVGPSPDWMVKRLEAAGLRSVNNVVDASNYAMMETGQPPHAFDYVKIAEGKIIVRKAAAGERIVSIDGTQCDLSPDMLIIADAKGPVAVAGVMGGLDTEVSEATTTILLEDAYFDPVSVRTTSRRLSLPSEAAFRFERIVDIDNVDWASKRTAQLIAQAAGGKVAKGVVDVYPRKRAKREVTLRFSRVAKLLGVEMPQEEVVRILSALGYEPRRRDDLTVCTVPFWRSDVYREVDLIEEVARVYGYNKVPVEHKIKIEVVPADARQKLAQSIGTYLNGCGFYETVTVGFVDNSVAELFAGGEAKGHLAVQDVSRKTANLLRQTLIGSLLGVLKTNVNAKNLPCRIFEISDTFAPRRERSGGLPVEEAKLTLVCDSDLRDLRGVIEGLVKTIDRTCETVFRPTDLVWAQTGAEIVVNGKVVGTAGVVSEAVKDRFDFKELTPVAAELEFEQLLVLQSGPVTVKPIPRFPAIERDLSIIVGEGVSWAEIVDVVNSKAPGELEDIQFVDIYRGKGIPSGKKSVTLSLRFRDEDGTLTHETVDGFEEAIVGRLAQRIKAELRMV